jgi:hypothetical protein
MPSLVSGMMHANDKDTDAYVDAVYENLLCLQTRSRDDSELVC